MQCKEANVVPEYDTEHLLRIMVLLNKVIDEVNQPGFPPEYRLAILAEAAAAAKEIEELTK